MMDSLLVRIRPPCKDCAKDNPWPKEVRSQTKEATCCYVSGGSEGVTAKDPFVCKGSLQVLYQLFSGSCTQSLQKRRFWAYYSW